MRKLVTSGYWYCMCRPDGGYAMLRKGGGTIESSEGTITNVPDSQGPLYLRIAPTGPLKIAGQPNDSTNYGMEWAAGQWNLTIPYPYAVSGAIYDLTNVLHCAIPSVGANGYQYVDPTQNLPAGLIVTGDEAFNYKPGKVAQYTKLPNGWVFGQDYSGLVPKNSITFIDEAGVKRVIYAGSGGFVNVLTDGTTIAISFVQMTSTPAAWLIWATTEELKATYPVVGEQPPVPVPPTPDPDPIPTPIPPDNGQGDDVMPQVGQVGSFRVWGSTVPTIQPVQVAPHQDQGYVSIKNIKDGDPSKGKFASFDKHSGQFVGWADSAGYQERVTFPTNSVFLARPADPETGKPDSCVLPWEWYSL